MAAGRPIICTRSSMFSEFEEDKHVAKVDFGDKLGLARTISRVLTDKHYAGELVKNSEAYIRSCAPDIIAAKHEALYSRLIAREAGHE